MLAIERSDPAPGLGADPRRVAAEFRDRVLPCGVPTLNRLEAAVVEKLAAVRAVETEVPEAFPKAFRRVLDCVVSSRPHRDSLVRENAPEEVRRVLFDARRGRVGPADLTAVAERLAGAPSEVRLDVAAELVHAAAPDRIGLLARWVWNPTRRTGILGAFGGPPPESYAGAQARLGEVRLELDALGFSSGSFAAVDVLLALSYAARLGEAVERSFRGGGLERLLPGSFPLATMVLGVRRRFDRADR